MLIEIITPKETLFSGEAVSVVLPGQAGTFTILNHHAPIVSVLDAGEVVVETSNGKRVFEISGGFVELHNNNVTICAE